MSKVCIHCVKDKHLKKLIETEGRNDTCSICSENVKSIDYENSNFFYLVKALVRFHYSEWEYNTHLGGNGYEALFYGSDNLFFDNDRSKSDENYEELVLSITEGPCYEEYDEGICIFSGYTDGMQNMPLRSIKSDLDSNILNIAKKLKSENYFNLEDELKEILELYRAEASIKIDAGDAFYRARIGYKDKKRSFGGGFETESHFVAYSGDDIGAPPPNLAGAGRVNRPGVSFFYCATDMYTAIAEVRPHPGDKVSIGKFVIKSEAKLFDLSDSQLIHYYQTDKKLDSYKPFNTLGVLINKTISPSERQQYSITQLIADCIRLLGFDGITFSSTVGRGKNIVLFDKKIVDYVADEVSVFQINNVKYDYEESPLVSDDGMYV